MATGRMDRMTGWELISTLLDVPNKILHQEVIMDVEHHGSLNDQYRRHLRMIDTQNGYLILSDMTPPQTALDAPAATAS